MICTSSPVRVNDITYNSRDVFLLTSFFYSDKQIQE
jgi:hypothetical protein